MGSDCMPDMEDCGRQDRDTSILRALSSAYRIRFEVCEIHSATVLAYNATTAEEPEVRYSETGELA